MGTRHLVCVVQEGEFKVAQYGQWDGYPSGQGATVLDFLAGVNLDAFKAKIAQCRFGSKEEVDEAYKPYVGEDGWMNMSQSDAFKKSKFAYLSRDTGAEILGIIMESPGGLMLADSSDFAGDSLFCEYAYVIDLDKDALEVYRGFNHAPLADGERFKGLKQSKDDYYPIKLWKSFDLNALPSKEAFLVELEEREEETA